MPFISCVWAQFWAPQFQRQGSSRKGNRAKKYDSGPGASTIRGESERSETL